MIGYKAFCYVNGLLRSRLHGKFTGDIFEVGVPKQWVDLVVDDDEAYTEVGYRFSDTIEGVLSWENYILTEKERKINDIRLFKIDTLDGKLAGEGADMRTERFEPVSEVKQSEIIEYFRRHPRKLPDFVDQAAWKEYCSKPIPDYLKITKEADIVNIVVHNCARYADWNVCKQIGSCDLSVCEKCSARNAPGCISSHMHEYWYLLCRRKIWQGEDLHNIPEYSKLKGHKIEQTNLQQMYVWF